MGKGGKVPQAPPPLDPRIAISSEARANRFNTASPFGSVSWSGDPLKGMTQTTLLSPAQQAQLSMRNRIADSMLGSAVGTAGAERAPFTYDSTAGNHAADAYFNRQKRLLDPERAHQGDQLDQKLSNMGLPMGSEAYNQDTRRFDRNWDTEYANAADQATLTGDSQSLSQHQQRMNDIASALGNNPLVPPPSGGAAPIDVGGAFGQAQAARNLGYQGQLAGYNADVSSANSNTQAAASLAGTAAIAIAY